jgi:hypothetical protein
LLLVVTSPVEYKVVVEIPISVTVSPALAVINVEEVRPVPDTANPAVAVTKLLAFRVVVEIPPLATIRVLVDAP